MKRTSMILACNIDGGIGYQNGIPWDIPQEMQKFRTITTEVSDPTKKNAVIMGKNTWLSLRRRPLKNRINIVITKSEEYKNDNCLIVPTIEEALEYGEKMKNIEKIFIIGGSSVYNECLYKYNFDIFLSMLYYDEYKTDSYVDIEYILKYYNLQKHKQYTEQHENKLFASYICTHRIT